MLYQSVSRNIEIAKPRVLENRIDRFVSEGNREHCDCSVAGITEYNISFGISWFPGTLVLLSRRYRILHNLPKYSAYILFKWNINWWSLENFYIRFSYLLSRKMKTRMEIYDIQTIKMVWSHALLILSYCVTFLQGILNCKL